MRRGLLIHIVFYLLLTSSAHAQEFTYWENDFNVKANIEYVRFYKDYFSARVADAEYSQYWDSDFIIPLEHPDFVSNIGYLDIYKTNSDAYLMDIFRDADDSTIAHVKVMLYNALPRKETPLIVKQIVKYKIKRYADSLAFVDYFSLYDLDSVTQGEVTYFYEKSVPVDPQVFFYNTKVLKLLHKIYPELRSDNLVYFSFKDIKSWFSYFGNEYDFAWSVGGKTKAGYTDRNGVMFSAGFEVGYTHEILRQISRLPYDINFYLNQGFSILYGKHLGHTLDWHCELYNKSAELDTLPIIGFQIPTVSDASYVVGGMVLAELLRDRSLKEISRVSRKYLDTDEDQALLNLVRNELDSQVKSQKDLDKYLKSLLTKYSQPENCDFDYLL